MPETENLARAALERLENGDAWCKAMPITVEGRRCLVGAVSNATLKTMNPYEEANRSPIAPIVASVIQGQFPERYSGGDDLAHVLYRFNDSRDTTFDDVRVVLEKAAIQVDEILS